MKENVKSIYINYIDSICLSDKIKERICTSVVKRMNRLAEYDEKFFPEFVPDYTKVKTKAIDILLISFVSIIMAVSAILLPTYIIPKIKEYNQNANNPNYGTNTDERFGLGKTLNDINGNTICLKEAVISQSINVGGETLIAESGAFLLLSGRGTFTNYAKPSQSVSKVATNRIFTEDSVKLGFNIKNENDKTEEVLLRFREDLFYKYSDYSDGVLNGNLYFIFEIQPTILETIKQNALTNGTDSLLLVFENLYMQRESSGLSLMFYKISYSTIKIN